MDDVKRIFQINASLIFGEAFIFLHHHFCGIFRFITVMVEVWLIVTVGSSFHVFVSEVNTQGEQSVKWGSPLWHHTKRFVVAVLAKVKKTREILFLLMVHNFQKLN